MICKNVFYQIKGYVSAINTSLNSVNFHLTHFSEYLTRTSV